MEEWLFIAETKLPYPVLANSTYESSVKQFTTNNTGADRFSTACAMVEQYQKANARKTLVDYSFDILDKVAQGNFTKWSIVYDITNKKIYFKTSSDPQQKSFSLNDFTYACVSQPLSYNLAQNDKGAISKRFVAFANTKNEKMVKKAFKESEGAVNIGEPLQNAVAEFPTRIRCK